jgi:tol-pal system protein YbgF
MRRATIFAFLLALAGQAHAGMFDDDEARRKILSVEQEMRTRNQEMDARLAKLENSLKNLGLFELVNQLDALKGQLADMRGQIEIVSNQISTLDKKQKDFYLDLDTRLRRLEQPGGASGGGAGTAIPSTPGSATPVPPADPKEAAKRAAAEKRDYDAAYALFKKANYAKAIPAFQSFIDTYPGSPLAPSAQYWIGLSQYNLRNMPGALAAQQGVISKYPDSPKVPDAMLAIATIHADQGEAGRAHDTLEDIIARYPASDAASKARARLSGGKK